MCVIVVFFVLSVNYFLCIIMKFICKAKFQLYFIVQKEKKNYNDR